MLVVLEVYFHLKSLDVSSVLVALILPFLSFSMVLKNISILLQTHFKTIEIQK
jgi:hypothetical protein